MDEELLRIIDLFDDDEVTTADKIDRPAAASYREMFDDFNARNPFAGGGMLVQPGFGGTRQGYKGLEKFEIEKINNPSQEALDEISSIIDKYTKTSDVAGRKVKHLSKDGPVNEIFKEIKTKGYKRPSIAKPLFARILKEKGITTYDNYRTNKIVFTLQDVLRKNNGDILSIKPSAVAEILPEFAIEGKKGGKGLPAFRTFLNYLEGSQRLADRSGLQVPNTIAGKPVNQLVNELKQNFLDVPGGRARGNFTVFEETKLLDKIANENPKVKALDLKTLYEEAGGTNFRQRLLGLVPAKTGSGYTRESVKKFGINILDKVKEGVISNSLPESLKAAFKTYASSFNQARFLAEADKFRKSNPELAYRFVNAANIVAGKARRIGLTGAGEHALPVSAIKTANAPVETLLQIDAYVDPEINNWKAKNFDEAIFSPNNGLAVQYKKAKGAKKKAIQTEIMSRLAFMKKKAPDLMKNVKFDFTNGIFTASSTTKAIDTLNETELKQLGTKGQTIRNFFLKEMPDAVTINPETKRILSIKDSYIPITQNVTALRDQLKSFKSGEAQNAKNLLARIGCPGKATGGRVGFFTGQNLEACATKGAQKLRSTDPKNLSPADRRNFQNLTKTLQAGRVIKNFLGPVALAYEGLFALPFAAYDYQAGRPGADILKNVATLGFMDQKLRDAELKKIDPTYGQAQKLDEVGARFDELERLSQFGTRGQRIRNKAKFEKIVPELQKAYEPFTVDGVIDPSLYMKNIFDSEEAEKELKRQYDIRGQERKSEFDLGDPFMAAGGGIAGLSGGIDEGPQTVSMNPDSQGLRSLKNRVRNL